MRTRAVWFRVAAVAGILALGVAAAGVGTTIASAGVTPGNAFVGETMTVIAPFARGETPPAADLDDDADTFEVSEAIGETIVTPPPPAGAAAPETIAVVEALTGADDPAAGVPSIIGLLTDSGGDPCASTDAAPGDCPDGLRSTVLSLTRASLMLYTVVNPPAEGPDGYSVGCPAVDVPHDGVLIGAATSVPADVSVQYWPDGRPELEREVRSRLSDADLAEWEAADEVLPGLKPLVQHCLTLTTLQADTRYKVIITASTASGERRSETRYIGLERDLTRPPARVIPIGTNLVHASAPHEAGSSVAFSTVVLRDGATPDCSAAERAVLQPVAPPGTRSVAREYLERNGFLSSYTQRTGQAFYVPEGTDVLVCMLVYDDGRPSWEWETATYTYSAVVQAPDATVPTISWASVAVHPRATDGILSIEAAPRGGARCGDRNFNMESVAAQFALMPDGVVLCEADRLAGHRAVITGDVVIRTLVHDGTDRARSAMMLPLAAERCFGFCELPETTWYQVALPTVEVASGICGGSIFDSCAPPTAEIAAGTAQIRVDWSRGTENGQAEWNVGELIEGTPEASAATELPRMNTRAVLEEVSTVDGLHLAFDLETDRAAEFHATLHGECVLPGTVQEVTGSTEADAPTRVQFDRVCHGSEYSVSVALVDGTGAAAEYSASNPDGLWPRGRISTSAIERRLAFSYRISDEDAGRSFSALAPFEVQVNGTRIDLERVYDRCIPGDSEGSAGIIQEVGLSELVTITVTAGMREASGLVRNGGGAIPACQGEAPDTGERMTLRVTVPIADLTGAGMTITAPEDSPYEFSMTIRDWPAGS